MKGGRGKYREGMRSKTKNHKKGNCPILQTRSYRPKVKDYAVDVANLGPRRLEVDIDG